MLAETCRTSRFEATVWESTWNRRLYWTGDLPDRAETSYDLINGDRERWPVEPAPFSLQDFWRILPRKSILPMITPSARRMSYAVVA